MTTADARATGKLTDEQVMAERDRLGIPREGGQALRSWLRYQLQNKTNPKTKKPWTQADIARASGVSEGTVSVIYRGEEMLLGRKGEKVRIVTADALDIPFDILWPKFVPAKHG